MSPDISAYDLNSPKSYIGYCLAFEAASSREEADRLTEEYVVSATDMARRGAQNMGLIAHEREGNEHLYSLTERGDWLCSEAPDRFGAEGIDGVLEIFDGMRGARERFVSRFPRFEDIAADVILGDPAVERFVELLRDIHRDQLDEPGQDYGLSTNELFWECWERDPKFAGQFFIRDHEGIRAIVLGGTAEPADWESLGVLDVSLEPIEYGRMQDGAPVYRSATTFQLKNLLWHMGVTQSKGTQSKALAKQAEDQSGPGSLQWALEAEMLDRRPKFVPGTEVAVDG